MISLLDNCDPYAEAKAANIAWCETLARAARAVGEPTQAEIEATQTADTPESYAQDARNDEDAMNAAMLQRDQAVPRDQIPVRRAEAAGEPVPWHLRLAPWSNRFGGWGA